MGSMPTVRLKKNRERSLRRRHPWIFSGAIERVDGNPAAGDVVRVVDHSGAFAAWGYFNDQSQIRVRILEWREDAPIDDDWWRRRLQRAVGARAKLPSLGETNACRLVYAEADRLPGLIVDRYADYLIVQVLTAGIERVKPALFEMLGDLLQPAGIYERSDADTRSIEGLPTVTGVVSGESPPEHVVIEEGPFTFFVDALGGQKTGFYLDQRDNRRSVARYADGKDVLDLFSYSGAFSVHALGAGARSVTLIDSSTPALDVARQNAERNGFAADRLEMITGNAFDITRTFRDAGRTFGVIVCDPPKLAQTRSQVPKAERAYKDINLHAMKLLEADGILATFSCSGAIGPSDFSRIVAWAAIDAKRDLQVLHKLDQASDHPIDPCFPESEYLNGLVCRVL